jgi:hypothetical protein
VSQCGKRPRRRSETIHVAPDASSGRFVGPRVSSFSPILFCWVGRVAGGETDFRDSGGDIEFVARCPQRYRCSQLRLYRGEEASGATWIVSERGRGRPRHPSCYFFREALFVLVTHDDGVSLHLRNAGTTSACSSVGSFRLVRVSLVRFAPALYPIF